MKLKSEKGFTGVDVAIAVVVLFIFVSLIAIMSYRVNSTASEINLKAEATSIAVDEIEKVRNLEFSQIQNISQANGNSIYVPQQEVAGSEGFYKKVEIKDYADIKPQNNPQSGLVKQINVQVTYSFKGKAQQVELSTIIAKQS